MSTSFTEGGLRQTRPGSARADNPLRSDSAELAHSSSLADNPPTAEEVGFYVHVPFCAKRCGYCSFNTAPLEDGATARVRELAASVFALAGCSGLARCDFFVEPDGTVLVNEINTMPGFTETSVYAKLLEASGIAYPALCDRLVTLAVQRHERARSYEF